MHSRKIRYLMRLAVLGMIAWTSAASAGLAGQPCTGDLANAYECQTAYVRWAEGSCLASAPASDDMIYGIYERAVIPMIRETKRPLPFFHYGWRTPRPAGSIKPGFWDDSVAVPSDHDAQDLAGPVAPDSRGPIRQYIDRHLRGHYEAVHQAREQLGDGLYLATDPIQSINYSGHPGLLLRITLPSGTRYIDMRKHHTSWPVSSDEAFRINCERFRECHALNPTEAACTGIGGVFASFSYNASRGDYFISPNYDSSPRLAPVIHRVYRQNRIDALAANWGADFYPECSLVKRAYASEDKILNFALINPDLSPMRSGRLGYDLLVPNLEKNPSARKRAVYAEVIRYFDAVDVADVFKDAQTNSEVKDGLETFWEYYRAWAIPLFGLPADVDIEKFQRERRAKLRGRAALMAGMYGCSPDDAYAYEAESAR